MTGKVLTLLIACHIDLLKYNLKFV